MGLFDRLKKIGVVALELSDGELDIGTDERRRPQPAAPPRAMPASFSNNSDEKQFYAWVRVRTMLATGKVPAKRLNQAIKAAGVEPAAWPDVDRRWTDAVASDPVLADRLREATSP